MNYLKSFIDRVSLADSRNNKDVVLPINEARNIRDELSKVLLDMHESRSKEKSTPSTSVEVQFVGRKW